jgi:hypothetical protein
MKKIIAGFALAASLAGCASSPFTQAPAANVTPTKSPYAQPGIPQSQYECMTDEGYGRSFPCGTMN